MRLQYLTGGDVYAWAKRLIDDLNREPAIADLQEFADDAAASARVPVGGGYVTPEGIVRRRMT